MKRTFWQWLEDTLYLLSLRMKLRKTGHVRIVSIQTEDGHHYTDRTFKEDT